MMATEKRMIPVDVLLTGIATFKECYEGVGLKPWVVEHIQTALLMVERFVKESPTVDAVEVVHGYWVATPVRKLNSKGKVVKYCDYYHCSECGTDRPIVPPYNYCPNCGAKMDGEER